MQPFVTHQFEKRLMFVTLGMDDQHRFHSVCAQAYQVVSEHTRSCVVPTLVW